jgi:hypothetical protein
MKSPTNSKCYKISLKKKEQIKIRKHTVIPANYLSHSVVLAAQKVKWNFGQNSVRASLNSFIEMVMCKEC